MRINGLNDFILDHGDSNTIPQTKSRFESIQVSEDTIESDPGLPRLFRLILFSIIIQID